MIKMYHKSICQTLTIKTLCFNYCATMPPIFKVSIQHQKKEGEKSTEVK